MKVQKLTRILKANRASLMVALALFLMVAASLLMYADSACNRAAQGRVFQIPAEMPVRQIGLVLGTSKVTRHAKPNLHFIKRIEAAAALYHAGKVKHLLVSGDNHVASYNEPDDMRNALMAAGVPPSAITCDYAGFHTMDSIVRAKEVFSVPQCVIITEKFHCPRALWIADQHGLDAIGFAAPDVGLKSWSIRADLREQLARAWCAVDACVLHRGPKFLGKKEPILAGREPDVE